MSVFDESAAEEAIVTRLTERLQAAPRLAAEVFSDPARRRGAAVANATAEVVVRYAGSEYGPATTSLTDSAAASQERRPQISVMMLYRNAAAKKAHQGANAYIARIRAALRGYTIPGTHDATALAIAREGYLQVEDPAIWPYEFVFTLALPEVYALAAPPIEDDEGGEEEP